MIGSQNEREGCGTRVVPEELVAAMEQEVQQYLESVMEAVNDAPDGSWIAGSEESVRDLSADFRRRVFQRAVQMRVDAAEAAFPPSDQRGNRQASGE